MEYTLVFLPLMGAILSGFFGRYIGDRNSEIITSLLVSISALLSFIIFKEVALNNYENNLVILSARRTPLISGCSCPPVLKAMVFERNQHSAKPQYQGRCAYRTQWR